MRARERETDKGRRIRSSLWIYFVRSRPLERSRYCVHLSLRVGISALLDIVCIHIYIYIYIYIYIFLRTRVSVIYSRHGSICIGLAKCVGWARGESVGMTVPREANTIVARGTKLAFGKPGRER